MEKIIEIKNCKHCDLQFEITDKDLEFYEKVSPIFEGKRYNIPTPTLCPDCRQQRRLSFRNERKLYKRKCDATGEDIISMYSPDKNYKVYNSDFWWSDKWDVLDYGIKFDFNKSFFKQFYELQKKIPRSHSYIKNSLNCDYTNYMLDGKDNYLSMASSWSENVHYSTWSTRCNNSMDCLYSNSLENCYNCIYGNDLYNCIYCFLCRNSKECYLSYDLINCNNCFLSSNLVDAEYYFINEKLSPEKYRQKVKEYGFNFSWLDFIKNYIKAIHKENNNIGSIDCIGNELINSNNCNDCFNLNGSEDCKFFWDSAMKNSFCMDCTGTGGELCYEGLTPISSYNTVFTETGLNCTDVLYSSTCNNSINLFGCIGLKNKQYCIFNKQYTKEEYNKLVPKIIEHMRKTGEWGEFFPSNISPFGYNETVASEYFPLAKEEVVNKGFKWSYYEPPKPNVEKIISADKLPEKIENIPDDILNRAIECEVTKKPFRIIKAELEFYRKHNLPIPRRHPDQRHMDRMKLRNPRKLFDRDCDKCGIKMKTTYSPERREIVYCEECYGKEIY